MWEQYIEQHGRRLYGLCMTLCRDPFAAEDLYQETWLRALRGCIPVGKAPGTPAAL